MRSELGEGVAFEELGGKDWGEVVEEEELEVAGGGIIVVVFGVATLGLGVVELLKDEEFEQFTGVSRRRRRRGKRIDGGHLSPKVDILGRNDVRSSGR